MSIKEMQEKLRRGAVTFRGDCHDCGKPVEVVCSINENGEIVISGGAAYNPLIQATTGRPERRAIFVKCDKCYANDNILRYYQDTDIYSRVVGYLRPVGGWNAGKLEEFKQRKEFVVGREEIGKSVV